MLNKCIYLHSRIFNSSLWRTKLLVFYEHSKCSSFYLDIINIKNRFRAVFILHFFVFLQLDLANNDKSRDRTTGRTCS